MPIREFFHLIHVVDDIEEANRRYNALFGIEPFSTTNWSDLDHRWASFSMIADMMLEIIQPGDKDEDQGYPLTKFRNRFGQHLHSLSWYVDMPDMAPLFRDLRASGVRVAKPGGGLFADDVEDPGQTIFTHAKDTAGQLEFVGVEGGPLGMDPRSKPGWAPMPAVDSPMRIARVSHHTTSTKDLPTLQKFFERSLSATTLATTDSSAFMFVGTESIVELATATSPDSLLGRDLGDNGELPHGLTFRSTDLDAAERHAATVGVRVHDRAGSSLVLHPDDTFGAVITLSEVDLPEDPRGSL